MQTTVGPAVCLAALEARFLAMRQVASDLGAAFVDAFLMATRCARPIRPLRSLEHAGHTLVASIRANPGKTNDLPYHNQHHFAEAVLAMGLLCARSRTLALISPAEAALGVVAMVGHDIGHDGISVIGGVLEAHAAAETVRVARAAGVGEDKLARLAYVIQGTDPAEVADNEARLAGILPPGRFGASGDHLRSLANEADVMASLMPALGLRLGDAMAAERRLAGDPRADALASFSGRLAFLRLYARFTPAAVAMGLPEVVQAQIARLADAARSLNAGTTPEQGAAALDRMDPREARARYLSP